ncbi:MAG: hypothetical protein ACREGF_04895 [Candidatus Saccharimonadales bacterium]
MVELVHDELGSLGLFRELTDSRGRRRLVALQDSSLSPTRIDKVNGSAWLGKPGHEYKRSELPARQRTNTPANNSSHLKPVYKDIDKIRDEITATLNETALTIFLESLQLANDAK